MWQLVLLASAASASFLDSDIELTDGIKLVTVPVSNSLEEESGRSFGESSSLFRMAKFLQSHELHVSLPNLVEKEKLTQIVADSLKALDESNKNAVTGRKKDNGVGAAAVMGLMFAKTLGAVGIGGIGLLTMKALMLSALALMLSAIVGLKKLTHHDDDGGHQVHYVGGHEHHRRRRDIFQDELPLPYKGWTQYVPQSQQSN